MSNLRENERKILISLKDAAAARLDSDIPSEKAISLDDIAVKIGLAHSAVMRSSLSLQAMNLVSIHEKRRTKVSLNEEGKIYAERGLPERRLIDNLLSMGGEALVEEAFEAAGVDKSFSVIVIGWLSRKKWAIINQGDRKLKSIVRQSPPQGADEKLLSLLKEKKVVFVEDLDENLRNAVSVLKGRKILNVREETVRELELTEKGWKLVSKGLEITREVSQLTPELIATGRWREIKLLKYNIKAPVSKLWPGKKHLYLRFLDELKEKLVALGFKEMAGPIVEISFFNCEGLYMPQDHPAREVHDMYLVKEPEYGNLDAYEHFLKQVKETHENGWKTGSKGWGYPFSMRLATNLMLRSHTTSVSVRTLISSNLEIPGKYFAVARCYRPEVVDKTHLSEFNQVEGIIVGEDLTLRDLLGVLERFAIDIAGADKVKFRPDYFPFTEPSVELKAYKKGYGWLEFGGSGILRPEVTLPLGIEVPVLAWGLGVDRLFMMKAGIDDIRYLFSQDLDWIRRKELT
jgi:phenylalanyl-tRNA synthetase alpha chain